MKLKKNMKKAGVGLLVSAIAISGAFAWLKSSDTASKTNQLKVGGAKIIFDNQLDSVSLVDNSAIPMTKANAIANLTAYTFDIKNEGEVHLDYTISVDGDSYSNTFDAGKVNVLIAPIADDASAEEIKTALTSATIQRLSSGVSLTSSNLQAGTHQRYALIAFVDRNTKLAEYTGKEVSFKLRVDAIQHNVINAENYETLTKSQISTTVTVGGESKNVDVYNIEGDSKTDLLNKLQASGLTDTADVDAIIEVKGEDYDGINSTATFDVSSIANPGDEVVILHYNETTQEWEYVGRETVGEDNTVSGDFTSYSPVAFIVYKPDGSIVQKEYDSETGALIKETESKADGTTIKTEYDKNGEILNSSKTSWLSDINVVDNGTILAQGDFSAKGNLVTINNTQYKVLDINGTQAKVMMIENKASSNYVGGSVSFGGKYGVYYDSSNIKSTMESYYAGLPVKLQDSIIEQSFTQEMYEITYNNAPETYDYNLTNFNGDPYYLTKLGEISIENKKVYALGIDDVIAYLGPNFTPQELNKMFFENEESSGWDTIWLRTAHYQSSTYAFVIDRHYGCFSHDLTSNNLQIRPTFVIDLELLTK